MPNLLLEQYARYKKPALNSSPYSCLLNTNIELNPHQINAFCAAIQALRTGGIILADEVGLGKTIEAGLVLKYVIDSGAKRILIALPATLRKQWEVELIEKFSIHATILDRMLVEKDYYATKRSERKSLRYFCYEAATAAFVQKVAVAKNNPKGERIVMTLYEYLDSKIPDYYPTMYRDGYSPEQILHAARRKILREYEARKAAKRAEAEANEIPEVKIVSEVKIR